MLNAVNVLSVVTVVNELKGVVRAVAVRWPLGRVVDRDQAVPAVLNWPRVVDAAHGVNRRDLTHAAPVVVVPVVDPSSQVVADRDAVLVAVLNWPMDVVVDLGARWDVQKVAVQVAVPAVKVHELKGGGGVETAIESLGVMTANVGRAARDRVEAAAVIGPVTTIRDPAARVATLAPPSQTAEIPRSLSRVCASGWQSNSAASLFTLAAGYGWRTRSSSWPIERCCSTGWRSGWSFSTR
ncbi:MAG: hypothetical protein U0795_20515 [Pirellulales bacterium]